MYSWAEAMSAKAYTESITGYNCPVENNGNISDANR